MTSDRRVPRGKGVPSAGSTSSTLLRGIGGREEWAWRRFVAAYEPLIRWCARRHGLHGEDAADVVQQVWLRVYCGFHTFRRNRSGPCFRPWLWTLARSCSLDELRRRSRGVGPAARGEWSHAVPHTNDGGRGDAEGDMPREMDESLRGRLDLIRGEFSGPTWTAFWERTVEGRPAADIAKDLSMTVAAVHTARSRVLRRLRECLRDHPL